MSVSFSVQCKPFRNSLAMVGRAISGRTTMPILSHILIDASMDGVSLKGTDLEMGVSCKCAAVVTEEGAIAVPSKVINELLATVPDDAEVKFAALENGQLQVKVGKGTHKVNCLDADTFPPIPMPEGALEISVPMASLHSFLGHTLCCVCQDKTNASKAGVCFDIADKTLALMATTGYVIAREVMPLDAKKLPNKQVIMPERSMQELNRVLSDGEGTVAIRISDTMASFSLPGDDSVQFVTLLLQSPSGFVEWKIPMGIAPMKNGEALTFADAITLPTKETVSALRRSQITARDNGNKVLFAFRDNALTLLAESGIVGTSVEDVDTTGATATHYRAFNADYLLTALNNIETENMSVVFAEGNVIGKFSPDGDNPTGLVYAVFGMNLLDSEKERLETLGAEE